jgi:TubC N-terminal docking domain
VNAAEEIRALRARGVTLSVRGGRLKITAPEPLPDALMDALRTHKAAIMAALGDPGAGGRQWSASGARRR